MANFPSFDRDALQQAKPQLWLNPRYRDPLAAAEHLDADAVTAAAQRLQRFAPLLQKLFPELEPSDGLIESPIIPAGEQLWLKADHALPVAGSIKARGGIHEVLCFCESLAIKQGLLKDADDDYCSLIEQGAQDYFKQYTVAVGSTGNLGLSIGIVGAALGFRAQVHMSVDAKAWKKQRLRDRGVEVIEHEADYGSAVAAGRAAAQANPFAYFVDDENSLDLFMGYAVAAQRLKDQLREEGIRVDAEHPLFVYLPAGVGGAPGGICFGLKQCFGDSVHCFFAEPVQAPCMLLGLAGAVGAQPQSIYDYGLQIDTDADGLAVGTASQRVCDSTRHLVSGVYTVTDQQLYAELLALHERHRIEIEPSAAAALVGPSLMASAAGQQYLVEQELRSHRQRITHLAWLTGGSFVPEAEHQRYREKARQFARR